MAKFTSKRTEQLSFIEQEREMSGFLVRMLEETELDIEIIRDMFLEQFPGEEDYFDEFVGDFLQ